MKKIPIPSIVIIFLLAILVVTISSGIYYFFQYQKMERRLANPETAAKEEVLDLIHTIGKRMILPEEEPTVATISDRDKLSDQPFFSESQNGDKVLIFPQAKKVVLWRPSTSMIINVAPLILGEKEQLQATNSATSAKK